MYSLPANHDLWGESDDSAWLDIIGPVKQRVIVDDVHFLIWNETQHNFFSFQEIGYVLVSLLMALLFFHTLFLS